MLGGVVSATALVLLAAGQGKRFGADKLKHHVNGRALGCYAAAVLQPVPFKDHIAVTAPGGISFEEYGFQDIVNPEAHLGMAGSVRLGVQEAERQGAEAVLIALADMPFIQQGHIYALLARYRGADTLVASVASHKGPPALFGCNWFSQLTSLTGDRGAGSLLKGAVLVREDEHLMADIDRVEDLQRFR